MRRVDLRDERGQVFVLFALILPLILILTSITWDAGNWWVKRRNLQTKVDAAALAGGTAWGFPCTPASDTNTNGTGIMDQARKYFGQHITASSAYINGVAAANSPYTGTNFNPQVDGTPYQKMHVVLNGSNWYDSDTGTNPADKSGQSNPSATICESEYLNVRGTEQNSSPLFGWIPLTPSIKRQATLSIQETELRGLLPIAVRVPKPTSAAAVFYDERDGSIQAVRYFREICTSTPSVACDSAIPPGLGQWTTLDATGGNWARFTPGPNTGVVIATSFRAACNTGSVPAGVVTGQAPCMEDTGFSTVNQFCDQTSGGAGAAPVKCEDANGTGASQNVVAGLQFMRSYDTTPPVADGPPALRSVWFDSATGCGSPTRQSYFNSQTTTCSATLHANVDVGTAQGRNNGNTDVKYGIVYGDTSFTGDTCLDGQQRPNCDMSPSWSANVSFSPANTRYAVAIRVRLKNTKVGPPGPGQIDCGNNFSATCQWFYTAQGRTGNNLTDAQIFANPVQRAFMGNINRSGAVKWLRLTADTNCDGVPDYGLSETGEAASIPSGGCNQFFMTMGLQGGLSKDQDEPPIQLNIGATSQSSVLDCDPNDPNLKDEVQNGCQSPFYAKNKFNTNPLCPPDSPGTFFNSPKAAPFGPPDNYPPWRCVLTQTSNAANQVEQGFNLRFFGVSNNPTCPADNPNSFVKGRNYWHNANNGTSNSGSNDGSYADSVTFADDRVGYGVTDPDPSDNLSNRLKPTDPRLVTLFFTPYDSFTGNGNEIYPIVGFGDFYITGYGFINGSGNLSNDDPCSSGSAYASPGAGNKPPPDVDTSSQGVIAWGHFVKEVVPSSNGIATGVKCDPMSFDPCVPVLTQ